MSGSALPEDLITVHMRERGLKRLDFVGREPGMWSLHPPYRSAELLAEIPRIIAAVESGDVPEQ